MAPAKSLKQQSSSGSEASAAKTSWLWVCAATPQSRPAASGTTEGSRVGDGAPKSAGCKVSGCEISLARAMSAGFAPKATGCGFDRAGSSHNLGTLQGDGKDALASLRLELLAASDFGVIFKLDC